MIGEYQEEQTAAYEMVTGHMLNVSETVRSHLIHMTTEYLDFRAEVDRFQDRFFADTCNERCFRSKLSACCSKEGIITFFADVVINVLGSSREEIRVIMDVLGRPNEGSKCIYLGKSGCLWRVKPIVCEMFLCESAKKAAFSRYEQAEEMWNGLENRKKRFTWPDRPVLFDRLETIFIEAEHSSSLMYINKSPGLLKLKRRWATLEDARV